MGEVAGVAEALVAEVVGLAAATPFNSSEVVEMAARVEPQVERAPLDTMHPPAPGVEAAGARLTAAEAMPHLKTSQSGSIREWPQEAIADQM